MWPGSDFRDIELNLEFKTVIYEYELVHLICVNWTLS